LTDHFDWPGDDMGASEAIVRSDAAGKVDPFSEHQMRLSWSCPAGGYA